jgi:acetolactate synthase-1/2/3 large subunit
VRWAFTVPGESFLGLLDALPEVGIRIVATRHEGGASFMAEAVGQLTGSPAAVMGTRAVGAGNMAIGIHTARQNSTPLIALIGQVERGFRGREAFQESELVETPGGLTLGGSEIDDPALAAALLTHVLTRMVFSRPGPVMLSLPEDVLDLATGRGPIDVPVAEELPVYGPWVREALLMLANARRPLILAGGGVRASGASDVLVAFAEATGVPVMAAWRRPDVFPNDHPLFLGMTGYGSTRTVRPRIESADALLVIGCRLNEIASYEYTVPAATTKWVHVDLSPRTAYAGLSAPDLAIPADARAWLSAAVEMQAGWGMFLLPEKVAPERAAYVEASIVDDGQPWGGPGVHPGRVIATLNRMLPADAIVTTDAGNFGLWLARGFQVKRDGRFLGPTSGAMGYGLPAAIAASLCEPERTVVAVCGDGGFAMTMNELETAVREGAHPIAIVFDNLRYGTIEMHQRRRGSQPVATDLGPIDFAAVATACGALGLRVTRQDEFEPALRQALSAGRAAVLHLDLDQRWVSPDVIGRSSAIAP